MRLISVDEFLVLDVGTILIALGGIHEWGHVVINAGSWNRGRRGSLISNRILLWQSICHRMRCWWLRIGKWRWWLWWYEALRRCRLRYAGGRRRRRIGMSRTTNTDGRAVTCAHCATLDGSRIQRLLLTGRLLDVLFPESRRYGKFLRDVRDEGKLYLQKWMN